MSAEKQNQKTNLVRKAASIAAFAHKDQKRKTDNTPYIFHPMAVAQKLACNGISSEKIVAAALVHDVLKDTDYPADKIKDELGEEVLEIVEALAEDKSLPCHEREKNFIEKIKSGPEAAKLISLADNIHNLECFLEAYKRQGSEVWEKFGRSKNDKIRFEEEMLKLFKDSLNNPMIEEYADLIEKEKKLE